MSKGKPLPNRQRGDDLGVIPVGVPGQPLPPHINDLLANTGSEIDATHAQFSDVLGKQLDSIHDGLLEHELHGTMAIAGAVGAADATLQDAKLQIDKHIDKLLTGTLVNVLYSEAELGNAGVHVPISTAQIAVDMNDPSGEPMMARLMGFPPTSPPPADTPIQFGYPVDGNIKSVLNTPNPAGTGQSEQAPTLPSLDGTTGDPYSQVSAQQPSPQFMPQQPTPVVGSVSSTTVVVPPPVPPPGTTTSITTSSGTTDTDCGCAPVVNVTVNVPPPVVSVSGSSCPTPTAPTTPATTTPTTPTKVGGNFVGDIPGGTDDVGTPPADVPVPPSTSPPPDEPPPPGIPTIPGEATSLDWDSRTVCSWANDKVGASATWLADKYNIIGVPFESIIGYGILGGLGNAISAIPAVGRLIANVSGLDVATRTDNILSDRLASLTVGMFGVKSLFSSLSDDAVPNKGTAGQYGVKIATADWAETLTGMPMGYLTQADKYLFQYANPQFIPTQSECNDLYLKGELDKERWRCLTKAGGNLPYLQEAILRANQTRPGVSELVQLRLRNVISEVDFLRYMREQGVTDGGNSLWYLELAKQLPGAADLVRMMVRDAADDNVANQYQYDKDFNQKFTGPVKDWAKSQGLNDDVFKYLWRSHWVIPSNTQLYEMFHRLREDRPEVIEYDKTHGFNVGKKPITKDDPRPPVVDIASIKQALEVNDQAPAWIDALLSIAYHPINRTDAIDAFMVGTFDDKALNSAMLDNGYSPASAKLLVDIQKAKKETRLANASGLWTVRKIMTEYMAGPITGGKADQLLTPQVIDPARRQSMLQAADDEVDANGRRAWIKRARRAHLVGEWSTQDAIDNLLANRVPPGRAKQLVDAWDADRTGRFKEPSAKLILQWQTLNIITPDDAYRRLIRLGYNDLDARRMVYQGLTAQSEKITKDNRQAYKDMQMIVKDLKQAKKEQTADLKKRQDAIDAQMKKLQDEAKRIQTELKNRLPG